jgi:hypothetical protein
MVTAKVPKLRPVEGYARMTNDEVVNRASAVYTGLNGNPNFTNLPVAAADLKAQIDTVTALKAQAVDGSKKILAEIKKQVRVLIKMMRALGRYVELNCKDDEPTFRSSGFELVSTTKTPPAALTEKIRSITHGSVSGQIVVALKAVAKAGSYDLRYGPSANGGLPTDWTTKSTTSVRPAIVLDGLTPKTMYAFQARALVGKQFTDWTDPVSFICT